MAVSRLSVNSRGGPNEDQIPRLRLSAAAYLPAGRAAWPRPLRRTRPNPAARPVCPDSPRGRLHSSAGPDQGGSDIYPVSNPYKD